MTVNLYRRHKPNCLGGHAWQSRSSELAERRNTWKAQTHVPDHVYDEAKKHFTEQEIVDVTYLAAIINAWNRLAIALRAPPGHYRATKTTA